MLSTTGIIKLSKKMESDDSDQEFIPEEEDNRDPWFRAFEPEPDVQPPFNEHPGLRNIPAGDRTPIFFFMLLFSLNLMREIVRWTNAYARRFIRARRGVFTAFSRARQWQRKGGMTINEFKGFLAVFYNMGLNRKATISEYWNSRVDSQRMPWFSRMFSRNRYQAILAFLHIVDAKKIAPRNTPGYDPAARVKPLIDCANRLFKLFYVPRRDLTIDESLVPTKGRTVMKQYIPTKHAKFGVKLWMLVEAVTGYVLHMQIYRGKDHDPTPPGQKQGSYVVFLLLKAARLLHKGYHVVCDSFFACIQLARQLLTKDTYITGTLRSNRKMPLMIKDAQLNRNESKYARQGRVLVCAYRQRGRQNKPVRMVSTFIKAGTLDGKPAMVQTYNKTMGGVDQNDSMMASYFDRRKTIKVWKKLAFHVFSRIMLNAYLLYKMSVGQHAISRLRFIQDVIGALANEYKPERPQRERREEATLRRIGGGKEKDCCVCSRQPYRRRRSKLQCTTCGKGLHAICVHRHDCDY